MMGADTDGHMTKMTRQYKDSRAAPSSSSGSTQGPGGGGGPAGGLNRINDELQDVTRIMTKNMEDLLWRGDSLDRACPPLLLLSPLLRLPHSSPLFSPSGSRGI